MGAFSPVPGVPIGFAERVKYEVFLPTLAEMKRRGVPFKGVLFAGLMVDFARNQLSVLEFNCRFGDPETQVVLMRLDDDLYDWCEAVAKGELSKRDSDVKFSPESAVIVIASARGYPEKPEKGAVVTGGPLTTPQFFCAGVSKTRDGRLSVSGGRVFGAMGTGPSLRDARDQAYQRIRQVEFEGMHFRTDIGAGMGMTK
jgi:phosphoribosylamine--glycine ligase